ncbi:hypothetical protein U1Q18_048428 [Sarracenia purpurea var. burkii]
MHRRRAVVLRWWCAGVGDTKDGGSAHSVRISSPFPPISMSGSPKKGDEELSLEASRTPPIGAHFISSAPNIFPFSLLFSFKGHAWHRPSYLGLGICKSKRAGGACKKGIVKVRQKEFLMYKSNLEFKKTNQAEP